MTGRRSRGRRGRPAPWSVGVVWLAGALVTACSDADPASAPSTSVTVTTTPATEPVPATSDLVVATTEPPEPAVVEVEVVSDDVTLGGRLDESIDPFGEFVSCSGLRDGFGTYSVLVSTTTGPIRAVTAVTDGLVSAAGIHDATVRLELADGSAIDAPGTMTLLPGFQAGSFVASDADGRAVEGSFSCTGSPEPSPLPLTVDDGTLDVIDVFALLRQGDRSRLVGLAAGPDGGATIRCPDPGATGDERIVRVDGTEAIGAITSFRLDGSAGADGSALTMQVGGTTYRFDDVTLGGLGSGDAGSFSASDGTVAIDGAYRCN